MLCESTHLEVSACMLHTLEKHRREHEHLRCSRATGQMMSLHAVVIACPALPFLGSPIGPAMGPSKWDRLYTAACSNSATEHTCMSVYMPWIRVHMADMRAVLAEHR